MSVCGVKSAKTRAGAYVLNIRTALRAADGGSMAR